MVDQSFMRVMPPLFERAHATVVTKLVHVRVLSVLFILQVCAYILTFLGCLAFGVRQLRIFQKAAGGVLGS